MIKKYKLEIILGAILIALSIISLFVGVIDVSINDILNGNSQA